MRGWWPARARRCSPGSPRSAAARPAALAAVGSRRLGPGARPPDPVRCSRRRRPRACRSSSRSATGGCSSRRSRSTAARRPSWRPTSRRRRTPGIAVQACGDAHISNFGGFAAPDRRLVFGPNDFDETLPGPWEWDVKRMAASAEIAGRDVGLPAERRRRIVTACVREYREAMRGFASESHLDVWYDRLTASELVDRFGGQPGQEGPDRVRQAVRQGAPQDEPAAVSEAHRARRRRAALPQRPAAAGAAARAVRPGDARDETEYIRELLDEYAAGLDPDRRYLFETYRFVDMARKVVGVGQRRHARLGVPARRPRRQGPARPAGEGGAGVGARALPGRERVRQPRRAGRARPADLARGASTSSSAGSAARASTASEHDFYVRQLWDWKASVDLSTHDRIGAARLHAGVRLVAGPRARALGRPARDRRLPGRAARASTRRSRASPRPTPTRTSSTTSGWPTPSPRARSRRSAGSSPRPDRPSMGDEE